MKKFYCNPEVLVGLGYQWVASHTSAPSMALLQRLGYLQNIPVDCQFDRVRSYRIGENKFATMILKHI